MEGLMLTGETAVSLVDTFTTAVNTVKTDVLEFIGIALPVGLAIAGTIIAIRLGWKFFKGVAK